MMGEGLKRARAAAKATRLSKAELAMLERAFSAEINAGLTGGLHLIQTWAKVAKELAGYGLLNERTVQLGGRLPVIVTGYELTERGRLAYCTHAALSGAPKGGD